MGRPIVVRQNRWGFWPENSRIFCLVSGSQILLLEWRSDHQGIEWKSLWNSTLVVSSQCFLGLSFPHWLLFSQPLTFLPLTQAKSLFCHFLSWRPYELYLFFPPWQFSLLMMTSLLQYTNFYWPRMSVYKMQFPHH